MKGLIFLLLLAQPVYGEIYKWVDDNGKVHFSDTKPEGKDPLVDDIELQNPPVEFVSDEDKKTLEAFEADHAARKKEDEQKDKEMQTESLVSTSAPSNKKYECFSPSPSMVGGVLSQEEVNPRLLNTLEQNRLKALFRKMSGHWRGAIKGYTCFGSKEDPKPKPDNYSVTAEGDSRLKGSFHWQAKLRSTDHGKSREEGFNLYTKNDWLRFNSPNKLGDVEIKNVSQNSLMFLQKYWRGLSRRGRFGSGGGATLSETLISVNIEQQGITIERATYSRGMLSTASTWTLTKR